MLSVAFRAIYLTAVVCALAQFLLIGGYSLWSTLYRSAALDAVGRVALVIAVGGLVYALPAARCLARLFRERRIVHPRLIRERWVVASLVGLASLLGSLFFALWVHILVDALSRPVWPDEMDKIAIPIALSLMSLAFALLTGEFVLVGRDRARDADSSPDPFC